MRYYIIVNIGTMMHCGYAQQFPRHMVLAHILVKDGKYFSTCRHMRSNGTRFMLDNGACEGYEVHHSFYADIVEHLAPWVYVLPDLVGRPSVDSRTCSLNFMRIMRTRKYTGQKMYVPQGRTQDEVLDEFDYAMENFNKDTTVLGLGLARRLWGDNEESRFQMWKDIKISPYATGWRFHNLGAYYTHSPKVRTFYADDPQMIGVDSAKPCRSAICKCAYPTYVKSMADDSHRCADEQLLIKGVHAFEHLYGCIPAHEKRKG